MQAERRRELELRAKTIRQTIIQMLCQAGSGHPGGSLSSVEILTALYFHELNHRPEDPTWADRDRVVLSKGHGCPALYATMAEAGYFDVADLMKLRKLDSPFQGHPDRRKIPILDASTGSLGIGLSMALGMAVGLKRRGSPGRAFCILGDGEMQEGQIWEAAMSAPVLQASNLIAIGDMNGIQNDDFVDNILPLGDMVAKWESFGWFVISVDGHDMGAVVDGFEKLREYDDRPRIMLAQTVKGKGVSFMENNPSWHGAAPSEEEATKALAEIEAMEVA